MYKDGKYVAAGKAVGRKGSSEGLGDIQKLVLVLAAVLLGPALLKQLYEKLTAETVDLSEFNIVTHYDKPAIDMRDDIVRIQYCASWKVNGEFRRCALEVMQENPGVQVEGGPYTPPISVQYGIRAVRASQVLVATTFFFSEQVFRLIKQPRPEFMDDWQTSMMYGAGIIYGLDLIGQTLKSINAFEVTYNGNVLHSKLSSGKFPTAGQVGQQLRELKKRAGKST